MRELSLVLGSRYLMHDWYQVPVMLTESSVLVTMKRHLALVVSVIPAEAGIQNFHASVILTKEEAVQWDLSSLPS